MSTLANVVRRRGNAVFKNLSFRSKLGLVIAPPLLALVVFAYVLVQPRLDRASQATESKHDAEVSLRSMEVLDSLLEERGASIWLLAGNTAVAPGELTEARAAVDAAITNFDATLDGLGADHREESRTAATLQALEKITELRSQVDAKLLSPTQTFDGYEATVASLRELAGAIGTDTTDANLSRLGTATFNLMLAKLQYAEARDMLVGRLDAGTFDASDLTTIVDLEARRQLYLTDYQRNADPASVARFGIIANSAQASSADSAINDALGAASAGTRPEFGAAEWWETLSGVIDAYDTVEDNEFDQYTAQAQQIADDERSAALRYLVVAVAVAIAAAVSALVLSRSLVRRLRSISDQAQNIATERLPEVLEALRNPTREALAEALPQVSSDAKDEIGSLADSFNAVLRTSVETGLDHAQQRARTVTNMLVNLGRRNQSLIDRQLQVMDRLESRHDDPDLLEGLFEIDHMVTRMRRNAENLLVLAGQQQARSWTAPVPLAEVLQGAASESPDLARIDIEVDAADNLDVSGVHAVDVSHLIAELVENAVAYSSPSTQVVVKTERSEDGLIRVNVIDNGVGMSAEELAEANERLESPPDIDTIVTDRVGFQVVGRMAQRLDITVILAANPKGGMTARVDLPRRLFEHTAEEQLNKATDRSRDRAAIAAKRDDSVFRKVDGRRDNVEGEELLSDDELGALHELQRATSTETSANPASADTGLVKRKPGAAFVVNEKAAEADAGTFRRLPDPAAAPADDDAAFGRFKAISALQSAVLEGRRDTENGLDTDSDAESGIDTDTEEK